MVPNIIEQASGFCVAWKPPGWLSTPSRWGQEDARPVLGIWLQSSLGQRVYPVHRLDCEVEGLMIFALNSHCHRAISQLFEERLVHKTYEALVPAQGAVSGATIESGTTMLDRLAKGKKRAFLSQHGKDCVTEVVNVEQISSQWLRVTLKPLTGRPHQLRCQLALRGFPIANDQLYGGKLVSKMSGAIALKATRLEINDECVGGSRVWQSDSIWQSWSESLQP